MNITKNNRSRAFVSGSDEGLVVGSVKIIGPDALHAKPQDGHQTNFCTNFCVRNGTRSAQNAPVFSPPDVGAVSAGDGMGDAPTKRGSTLSRVEAWFAQAHSRLMEKMIVSHEALFLCAAGWSSWSRKDDAAS